MCMGGWEAETGELPGTESTTEMSRNSTSAKWGESAPDSCPPCVHHGTSVLAHTKKLKTKHSKNAFKIGKGNYLEGRKR